jgi:hypothetical protein
MRYKRRLFGYLGLLALVAMAIVINCGDKVVNNSHGDDIFGGIKQTMVMVDDDTIDIVFTDYYHGYTKRMCRTDKPDCVPENVKILPRKDFIPENVFSWEIIVDSIRLGMGFSKKINESDERERMVYRSLECNLSVYIMSVQGNGHDDDTVLFKVRLRGLINEDNNIVGLLDSASSAWYPYGFSRWGNQDDWVRESERPIWVLEWPNRHIPDLENYVYKEVITKGDDRFNNIIKWATLAISRDGTVIGLNVGLNINVHRIRTEEEGGGTVSLTLKELKKGTDGNGNEINFNWWVERVWPEDN